MRNRNHLLDESILPRNPLQAASRLEPPESMGCTKDRKMQPAEVGYDQTTPQSAQALGNNSPGIGAGTLLAAIFLGGTIGLATVVGDWVSAGFLLFILILGVRGYFLGAMKIASGILGLLAAINGATLLSPYLAQVPEWLQVTAQWEQVSEPLREMILVLLAGLLIGVVVMSLTRVLASFLFHSKPRWKWIDSWLGAIFGGVEGIVLSSLLVFTALLLEPIAKQQLETNGQDTRSKFFQDWSRGVVTVSRSIQESSIGNVLGSLEPLRLRFNEQMGAITQITGEQNKTGTSFQESLKQMIEKMKNDPTARSELAKKTHLDDKTLHRLLNSEQFSETLDSMFPRK